MAAYWQPTAAGYFGRVSKQQTLDAITEVLGPSLKASLATLKKEELARSAEKRLKASAGCPPSCGGLTPALLAPAFLAGPVSRAGSGNGSPGGEPFAISARPAVAAAGVCTSIAI